jgi:hypothetical protein
MDRTNKFVRYWIVISPQEVADLGTLEGETVLKCHRANDGYWFSEMYQYMPDMRGVMRKVLKQLVEKGLGDKLDLQLKQYDLECTDGLF